MANKPTAPAEPKQHELATRNGTSNAMPGIASRAELLQEAFVKRGIAWTGAFEAPTPDILDTFDTLSLCDRDTAVKGAEKQSPLLWKLGEPTLQPSTKEGSKSFLVMEAFHEDWGPILLTSVAVYHDDRLSPLYEWVRDQVPVGGVFRFATFGTQKGYHVIRPIPVG